jgi:MFS family permease
VSVLLPRLVKIDLGGSAVDYGIVLTAGGIGGIAGSLAIGQLGLPRRRLPAMYACWVVGALGITGFGLAGELWQLFAIELVAVAALDVGEIIWFTLLQERVPDRLLGRVGALDNFASLGLVPVSMALAGPAGDAFGTRTTLVWAGVAAAGAIAAAFVLTPSLRRAEAQPAGASP